VAPNGDGEDQPKSIWTAEQNGNGPVGTKKEKLSGKPWKTWISRMGKAMREYKSLRTISLFLQSRKHTKPVAGLGKELKKRAHKITRRRNKIITTLETETL